ncbi:MAG: hypothetical protein U9N79_08080 [Actinomycetota bacterium]|nr:hypothetical protein [Actinomycetota bacterium]
MIRITSIKGGADPCMAAAIAATIAHLEDADAETRATRTPVPRPSHWVQSNRPRESATPLPSHLYDATPWADLGESSD